MNSKQQKSERDLELEGFVFYECQPLRGISVFARQSLKNLEFRSVKSNGEIVNGNLFEKL